MTHNETDFPHGNPKSGPLEKRLSECTRQLEETRAALESERRMREAAESRLQGKNGDIIAEAENGAENGKAPRQEPIRDFRNAENPGCRIDERLTGILESMTDAFIAIDRQWKVTYVNSMAEFILGQKRGELLTRNFRDIFSNPYARRFLDQYAYAMSTGAPVDFEQFYTPLSIWIEVRAYPSAEGLSIFFRDVTGRKEAEKALLESREDLNRAQAVAHVGSWRIDISNNRLRWSDEVYRIFEIAPGTPMTYEVFLSAVHPDDRERVELQWSAALTGKSYDIEHRIVTSSGIKWVREKAELELDTRGDLVSGFGTTQDITEQVKIEEALRISEAQLNAFFVESPVLMLMLDDELRFIKASRAEDDDVGMTLEEYRGKRFDEVEPQIMPVVGPSFEKVLRTGRPDINIHVRGVSPSHPEDIRHWLSSHFPVTLPGGRWGVGVVGVEITDRIRAEDALKTREREYRILAENSPDVIARFDRDLRHTYINPYGEKVYGLSRSEIIGKTNAELGMPADKVAFWKTHFENVWATGKQESLEFEFNSPNFGRQHFFSIFAPEKDDQGRVQSILAITRDISDIKNYQARLERTNQELEQFAYIASHDLQEPLRIVENFTELIERRYSNLLDERGRTYMQYITDSTLRMQQLIRDLLSFSRAGRTEAKRRPVDAELVLDRALTNLSESIRETRATVTHDPLPTVLADETGMSQLLQNLLGNALKFKKPDAAPRVHVSARRTDDMWRFSISDNGIGIDPKYFSKLFAVFQRLHSREEYPGTGIGLAICKKIVDMHGGRIWVESMPGSGSTFFFTLPAGAPS